MPLHSVKHFLPGSSSSQAKHGIQRIEPEEIMMRPAGGRARTSIANMTEAIESLKPAAGDLRLFRYVLRDLMHVRGQIENDPMSPHATGRIRVLGDQDKAACA